MKFSIVIPVYNVEHYLGECLHSIVNQTYRNLEIIIVNDGSTDQSLDIINEYAKKDSRIVVINQRNQGLSIARNVGIEKATGDYLIFVDSDDYISTDVCQKAIDKIQKGSLPDMLIYARFRFYNGKYVEDKIAGSNYVSTYVGVDYLRKTSLDNIFYASACNKIYNKKFIERNQLRFIKDIYHEDLYFTFCSLIFANKVNLLPSTYYYYRWDRPNSIVNVVSEKSKNILITVEKMENLLKGKYSSILDEYFFKKIVYQSVSSAVCYRFLYFRPLSCIANRWVKEVLHHPIYYKYVRYFAYTPKGSMKYKFPAWLSLNLYPLFVLFVYSYFFMKRLFEK